MIEIKNLNKKYKNTNVLHDINLSFPSNGLIAVLGPSGCGKTTLLNCIGGLLDYEGSITIDNCKITDKGSENFRLTKIGYVFQDFRLFNNETILENILFPLDTSNNARREKKIIKCRELLKLVDLKNRENTFVSTLSGGEKQRVCIARSLVNDPKIVLADEPTGALDVKNTRQIMVILKRISKTALVIMVTHDRKITTEYCDETIEMKDGIVSSHSYNQQQDTFDNVPIIRNPNMIKKPKISKMFLLKHSFRALSRKKVRSFICTFTTSLSLIGIGLALSLSMIISNNIKSAYSSLIKKDQLIVSVKDEGKNIYGEYAASSYEVNEIAKLYSEYVTDTGVDYIADFENIFLDSNTLYLESSDNSFEIKGFGARNINEFEWIDTVNDKTFYPRKYERMENDEVSLGLSNLTIIQMCNFLKIEKGVNSLSKYLLNHECLLVFDFAHLDWDYFDQQVLRLKSFTLENTPMIYHSNHKWNEHMLEERMRFPTNDAISEADTYPWTLKKIPYIYCENTDSFLTYLYKSHEYDYLLFEIGTVKHFPLLYKNVEVCEKKRVLVFTNNINNIPLDLVDYFQKAEPNLYQPVMGCYKGYVIYPSALMMGFSDKAFLSNSLNHINDAIDLESADLQNNGEIAQYPNDLVVGHFTKSIENGLDFSVIPPVIYRGNQPKNLDEIAISTKIFNLFEMNEIGEIIYFSFPESSLTTNTGEVINNYKVVPLKVTGIVESNNLCIYHNQTWPISFFQSRIGISIFALQVQAISFSVKNNNEISSTMSKLKRAFPQYSIINPLNDVNNSIDDLCKTVSLIATIFSVLSSFTAVLLLSICTYLHVFESKKEIGLARCIGVTAKEANKFIYAHSLTLTGIAFCTSSLELVFSSLIISYELNGKISFDVSPISFIVMLLFSLVISVLSSKIISINLSRQKLLESIKY